VNCIDRQIVCGVKPGEIVVRADIVECDCPHPPAPISPGDLVADIASDIRRDIKRIMKERSRGLWRYRVRCGAEAGKLWIEASVVLPGNPSPVDAAMVAVCFDQCISFAQLALSVDRTILN
jgi:hypothetical protein